MTVLIKKFRAPFIPLFKPANCALPVDTHPVFVVVVFAVHVVVVVFNVFVVFVVFNVVVASGLRNSFKTGKNFW